MTVDLNHLLYHHQLSLIRAEGQPAACSAGAFGLVRHYQTRIDRLRDLMGVSRYPAWCMTNQTLNRAMSKIPPFAWSVSQ